MKIRAGYIYDLSPVPNSSFDPQVPDSNRHIFTVGRRLKIMEIYPGHRLQFRLLRAPDQKQHHCDQRGGVPLTSQRDL